MIVLNKRGGSIVGPRGTAGAFEFKPGVNDPPPEYFHGLDEHGREAIESYFECGWLDAELDDAPSVEVEPPPEATPTPGELPEDEAAALAKVAASADRRELTGWLEHEKRDAVFDALVDRLTKLDGSSTLEPASAAGPPKG